jgi:hypothetical protein
MNWTLPTLTLSLALTGCTGGYLTKFGDSFEGQGDYIVISPDKGGDTHDNQWEGKYVKNVGSTFVKNDIISITLKSAYIYSFPESRLKRASNAIVGSIGKPSPVRGQVAILANVIEFKNGVTPAEIESNGRVIFYSNDVYEGQLINRSFTPIYGPEVFTGEPLMIKFQLMELDQEDNAQLKAVLKSVADIGMSSAGPSSSKLIEGLNKIGDSLINSNADDKFGEYGAVFVPTESRTDEHLPVLRRGDIIFTRNGDRQTPINWNKYCYNELQALLQVKDSNNNTSICNNSLTKPPDFSYIVASIQKNVGTNSVTPTKTLEELQSQIQGATSTTAIRNVSNTFSAEVLKNSTSSRIRIAIKKILDPLTPITTRRLEAAIIASGLQCSSIASPVTAPSAAQIAEISKVCGDSYATTSLDVSQYEYFLNQLVVMDSCLAPDEVTEGFWSGGLTASGLASARSNATSKIALCKAQTAKPAT